MTTTLDENRLTKTVALSRKVFHFNDQSALTIQSNADCEELYEHFLDVLDHDIPILFAPFKKLVALCGRNKKMMEMYDITWKAKYGCAILIRSLDPLTGSATVIGLERWKYKVHASVGKGREATSEADIAAPTVFLAGNIPRESMEKLYTAVEKQMGRARNPTNHQKHHWTPSFVWARLLDAMVEVGAMSGDQMKAKLQCYQGGTTDVGQHTGCLPRNTSFPLVAGVFAKVLWLNGDLDHEEFHQLLVVYYLHHLSAMAIDTKSYDPRKIDGCIIVIREIERFLFLVKDTAFHAAVVTKIKSHHCHLVSLKPCTDDKLSCVPKIVSVRDECKQIQPSSFPDVAKLKSSVACSTSRVEQAKAEAKKNLYWSDLEKYSPSTARTQDAWTALARLNRQFWQLAKELHEKGKKHTFQSLRELLEHHSHATRIAQEASRNRVHIMSVDLRSCEMLATWITFCWAHRIALEKHSFFSGYSAALDPMDLQYLVLQEEGAINAVGHVRRFLEGHRISGRIPFRNQADTLDLALRAGQSLPEFKKKYLAEHAAAETTIEERYREVQETQQKLRELDRKLVEAKRDLNTAQSRLDYSERNDWTYSKRRRRKQYTSAYHQRKSERDQAQSRVSNLESQIRALEKQPPDVLLPLPRNECMALQWLFFLFMPTEFSDLLQIAHLSQSMLWNQAPPSSSPRQDLIDWFNEFKTASNYASRETMTLGSSSNRINSPLVKGLNMRHYGKETGVFFPDTYITCPCWVGTDPFSAPNTEKKITRIFTEELPAYAHKVQPFLWMLPSSRRGNDGIAVKYQKPDWLTQEEFHMFSVLRAFPNSQIRQLLSAIVRDQLPFDHDCVLVLVKQLLYHVGLPEWKKDLETGDGYKRLADQLCEKATTLQESTNNTGKLLLFGIMSSFLGQFCRSCLDCSKEYTKVCRSLADQVHKEVCNAEHVSPQLYWKQAKLYGCAILSHCVHDNSITSLLTLVELIVLYKNKVQFASQVTGSDELNDAILCHMTKSISHIVSVVSDRRAHLTKCLARIIAGAPSSLDWKLVEYGDTRSTACFEAIHAEHHYSINTLNGTVLVDGVPPGFLPSSILNDKLYQRTFGTRNFECIVVDVAHYRTSRVVDDKFIYEFKQHQGILHIIELERHTTHNVSEGREQVAANMWWPFGRTQSDNSPTLHCTEDNEGGGGKFSDHLLLLSRSTLTLPTLLVEPYSHWYSVTHDAIFMRNPSYKCRKVWYVMTRTAIFRVPIEDASLPTAEIAGNLGQYARLVLSKPQAVSLLGRIENADHILAWVNPDDSELRFSLPRLDLEFCQTTAGIESINFNGFTLRSSQLMNDALLGVSSFLVLVDTSGNEKVLIPSGTISDKGAVVVSNEWDLKSVCHIYDVHGRFGHLIASDSVGRLQLAGIYAATSCYTLPNMRRAIELVRHCWTNEPLTDAVKAKLVEVSGHSKLSCTLRLLCTWIWTCSNRLSFLCEKHDTMSLDSHMEPTLDFDPLAAGECCGNKHALRLLPTEEFYILGMQQVTQGSGGVVVAETERTQNFVNTVERNLVEKMMVTRKNPRSDATFPLELNPDARGLEETINADLLSSWEDYRSLKKYEVRKDASCCEDLLVKVKAKREVMEEKLFDVLNTAETDSHELAMLSGTIREANAWDLLHLATNEAKLVEINPHLTKETFQKVRSQLVEWMILCVLEDKVSRIMQAQTDHQILVELRSTRKWNPWQHVKWLVFEVERRLQIRPYQHAIVDQLLKTPGSMIQLNMGLGKTSVLVPMLILELSRSKEDVVRINMLSSIISVAKDIYKSILTASILNVKVFLLPFQRNYPLDQAYEKVISEELHRCKDGHSCLLVTPQHRNSLLLKQYDQNIFVDGLKGSFIDVIDESDAILDSSFQLVYALGDQKHLPDGDTRWKMMESFLMILSQSDSPAIRALKEDPKAVHIEKVNPGTFPMIRLLSQSGKHEQAVATELCEEIISNPPHEFLWLKRVTGDKIPILVKIMSDPEISADSLIKGDPIFSDFKCDILAARGCIACGLLFHCLRARHRVNYGIDRSRKKMAVPFLAADTPNPRADYSHPDAMILYTCLSYFHDGLTQAQLKQALKSLQKLGPTAQETIYGSWIKSIENGAVSLDDLRKFDSYDKVDIDNSLQLALMHTAFSHCMLAISFWMNDHVFPLETHVFPGRRVTSAWNLVDNGRSIGFSGTDDNRFLLPLFVNQVKQDVMEIRATNGEMIDRILTCTRHVGVLDDQNCVLWKVVLNECVKHSAHALIDVGGLMAGVSNQDVAIELSERLSHDRFRGVVYFDSFSQAWHVFQFKGKLHLPLQVSSLEAKECFAYYDESRCRGSDLKLLNDSCGLVTLEPRLTKDRFLQGCARLRQLRGDAQSIVLAGTSESLATSSSAKEVLEDTIRNTAIRNQKRVMELYDRGMDHVKFPAQVDMDVTLSALYAKPRTTHDSISAFFEATVDQEVGLSQEQSRLIDYCTDIGKGIRVRVTQLAEECERELEDEEEQEEEEEMEVQSEEPYSEVDWDFQGVFATNGLPDTKVIKIPDLANELLGLPISDIQWSENLMCTANWRNTVRNMSSSYLRPVNSFLAYPDGKLVLISDYEADKLLPVWWKTSNPSVKLGCLSLATSSVWLGQDEVSLPVGVLASAKVFAGYVSFKSDNERKQLKELFVKPQPRRAIQELLQIRHRTRFLDRSDLDVFSLTFD